MSNSPEPFSSNAVRLSCREWIWATLIFAVIICLVPGIWAAVESYQPSEDYRLPYPLSDDYWVFRRWCRYTAARYPFLVLGDSVIWGQYVKPEHTLVHCLNEEAGKEIFANLAVDGIHPAAMAGLVEYHGRDIRNKNVVLHLNPLWMSSPKHDLQLKEEFRFNHPKLVPQVYPDIACYRPTLADIVGAVAERNLPFFTWTNHLRCVSFENLTIQDWTMEHPYANPLAAIRLEIPAPENEPKSKPISWVERGTAKQDFPWVEPEKSLQWASFRKVVQTLIARGNRVFIVIGPMNSHMLAEKSLLRYNLLKGKLERWLAASKVPHLSVRELPSRYYADASHPLKEGYSCIAKELFQSDSFREWLKASDGGER